MDLESIFGFVYAVREGSSFIRLHLDVQSSWYPFVETVLPPLSGLGILVEDLQTTCVRASFRPLFCWSLCLSLCQHHTVLITVALYVLCFEIRKYKPSRVSVVLQDRFG